MQQIKGTLIPIGGNEDKGVKNDEIHTLDFICDGILSHVVRETGGENASIVVVPTASRIPKEVGRNYVEAFAKLGCSNVEVLDIRSRADAEDSDFVEKVQKANCVMFSGGDQSKITDKIGGSPIHELLRERYLKEDGFVIAGTSAGAMAMANEMIAGGSSTEAFFKDAVHMYQGLGLIPELIIDTHFIQRGRFGRQSEAVAKFPDLLGVGLAEDTGLVIKNGRECKVIGSGMVILFDGKNLTHNNEKILKPGTPMTMTNLVVHVLSNGDMFDLKTRTITVLPMESPFV